MVALRRFVAFASLLILVGCASTEIKPEAGSCLRNSASDCYPVWFATNRTPVDSADFSKGFSDIADESVHFGRVMISVPGSHLKNQSDSPHGTHLKGIPLAESTVDEKALSAPVAWEREIKRVSSEPDINDRDIVIYVPGFGNTFAEATEHAATLCAALQVNGAMAMFSWPSRGKRDPLNYLTDLAAIENSEEELAAFLARLGRLAKPGHVHIIAHSMEVYGLLRALQSNTARSQILDPKLRFGQIILAAPDVNAHLFRRLATAAASISNRTTLYVADEDLALKVSEYLHGDQRIGPGSTVNMIAAIDTIEVLGRPSKVETGHSYFRDSPGVVKDIKTLIDSGESPQLRALHEGSPLKINPVHSGVWVIHNDH